MNHALLPLVGWQETVSFPDWKSLRMKAKIDTGAASSAIHAESYEIVRLPSTAEHPVNEKIQMKVIGGTSASPKTMTVEARIVDYRNVKNSGGKIEERPFIETDIMIGGHCHKIILSVTNREKMKFPVLLGRAFLSHKFVVDPSGKYLMKKKST
jgi:hypothetical protein